MKDYFAMKKREKEAEEEDSESEGEFSEASYSQSPSGVPPLLEGDPLPPSPPPTSVDASPKGDDQVPPPDNASHQDE